MTLLASPFVRLGSDEVEYDRMIADARFNDVARHGRLNRARLADNDDELANHLLGVHGEHAFAKWLGIVRPPDPRWGRCSECDCYIGTVNTFGDRPDVDRYQVRTRRKSGAPLILRESDKDYDVFVLVTVRSWEYLRDGMTPVSYEVEGWISGREGKILGERVDPGQRGPCWMVRPDLLNVMLTLPRDGAEGGIDRAATVAASADGR